LPDVTLSPSASQNVPAQIYRYAHEPRSQRFFGICGRLLYQTDESFLANVVSICRAAGHSIRQAPQKSLILVKNLFELHNF
jgi:hypothetical protein